MKIQTIIKTIDGEVTTSDLSRDVTEEELKESNLEGVLKAFTSLNHLSITTSDGRTRYFNPQHVIWVDIIRKP